MRLIPSLYKRCPPKLSNLLKALPLQDLFKCTLIPGIQHRLDRAVLLLDANIHEPLIMTPLHLELHWLRLLISPPIKSHVHQR